MCGTYRVTRKLPSASMEECVICFSGISSSASSTLFHGTDKCDHRACTICIRRYFNGALNDMRYTSYDRIQCPSPDCKQNFIVTDKLLQTFFDQEDIDAWWKAALVKSFIVNKVCCPMVGCGALFDVDEVHTKTCTFTECYECHRGFCIPCEKSWHPGEIQVFDDAEATKKTLEEAKLNSWCRCPKCAYIIEKRDGCVNIICRCGSSFCYRCGRTQCNGTCNGMRTTEFNEMRKQMFVYKAGY